MKKFTKTINELVMKDIKHDCSKSRVPLTYAEECVAKGAINLTKKYVLELVGFLKEDMQKGKIVNDHCKGWNNAIEKFADELNKKIKKGK